jgi:hypothetical protein
MAAPFSREYRDQFSTPVESPEDSNNLKIMNTQTTDRHVPQPVLNTHYSVKEAAALVRKDIKTIGRWRELDLAAGFPDPYSRTPGGGIFIKHEVLVRWLDGAV